MHHLWGYANSSKDPVSANPEPPPRPKGGPHPKVYELAVGNPLGPIGAQKLRNIRFCGELAIGHTWICRDQGNFDKQHDKGRVVLYAKCVYIYALLIECTTLGIRRGGWLVYSRGAQ
jgi:hypothetical protein